MIHSVTLGLPLEHATLYVSRNSYVAISSIELYSCSGWEKVEGMSGGTIYMVGKDGHLARMRPSAPANEDHMQSLVAQYPELIGDTEGFLLLIRREQPISDALDAPGRWSLDHLFVTETAIPVLVELKRATDTRLRREIVGQMLDYAANGVAYWQEGTIAGAFYATCEARSVDPAMVLAEFLGDADPATFWGQVDANFQAGRIKLVFVADVIPRELARIVEFLNEQMKADVRAIELKWYEGEGGVTTLVPRTFGETERALTQKGAARTPLPTISINEWIEKNVRPRGEAAVPGAQAFVSIIEEVGGEPIVASQQGSIYGVFRTPGGKAVYPLHLWASSGGVISPSFGYLTKRPGLAEESIRKAFYDDFVKAIGPLSTGNLAGFPSFKVATLDAAEVRAAFVAVVRRFVVAAATDRDSRLQSTVEMDSRALGAASESFASP